MKKHIVLFLLSFVVISECIAQYGNFRKYQIAQTGYYCYFPANPGTFTEQTSEDGQLMYMGQVEVSNNTFGIIIVLLDESFARSSKDELKNLLVSYLDYLKTAFEITGAVGYGYGHTLTSSPDATGVLDYWENKEGLQMVVKGWINQTALAFLYIRGKELPQNGVQSMYLNGFIYKK